MSAKIIPFSPRSYRREIDWYGRLLKLVRLRAEIDRLNREAKAELIAARLSQ